MRWWVLTYCGNHFTVYMCPGIMLYTLHFHSVVRQWYLNKAGVGVGAENSHIAKNGEKWVPVKIQQRGWVRGPVAKAGGGNLRSRPDGRCACVSEQLQRELSNYQAGRERPQSSPRIAVISETMPVSHVTAATTNHRVVRKPHRITLIPAKGQGQQRQWKEQKFDYVPQRDIILNFKNGWIMLSLQN